MNLRDAERRHDNKLAREAAERAAHEALLREEQYLEKLEENRRRIEEEMRVQRMQEVEQWAEAFETATAQNYASELTGVYTSKGHENLDGEIKYILGLLYSDPGNPRLQEALEQRLRLGAEHDLY